MSTSGIDSLFNPIRQAKTDTHLKVQEAHDTGDRRGNLSQASVSDIKPATEDSSNSARQNFPEVTTGSIINTSK